MQAMRYVKSAAAGAGISAIMTAAAMAQQASPEARALGQEIFDTCNPIILEPKDAQGNVRETEIKDCMAKAYYATRDYGARAVADLAEIRPYGMDAGFEYGVLETKLRDQCITPFLLDTTKVVDGRANILHNTDVTNDCLFTIFETNARVELPSFDIGVSYTLQNATNCLAEIAGKWEGTCKRTNGSPYTPVPFR